MKRKPLLTKNNRMCPKEGKKIEKEKETEKIWNRTLERVGETRKRQLLNEGSTEDVKQGMRGKCQCHDVPGFCDG